MIDRITGTTYSNPIWYRQKWRIYLQDNGACPFPWAFVHDDYDGADDSNDGRCGNGQSEQDCKNQIDEWEAEHAKPVASYPAYDRPATWE